MKKIILLFLLILTVPVSAQVVDYDDLYVNDYANIFTEEQVIATGLPIYSGTNPIIEDSDISVYPIPAKGILYIELNNSTVGICDIYDAQGRLVKHMKLTSQKESLNISEYSAGNYFIRIITDNSIEFRKVSFVK